MSTGERLLYLLKTRGPQTAQALAQLTGLTTVAVRKQLDTLAGQSLVESADIREGIGRPARHYRLSAAGHGRFPDRHGDLTVRLIEDVRDLFGDEGLNRLIRQRELQAESQYQARLAGRSLAERVVLLAQIRREEGYMAEAIALEGMWALVENHCPICAAARACQGFCRSELELFQRCLGPEASVERSEHLLAGARRCVYLVRPVK